MSINSGNKFDVIRYIRITEKATKTIQDNNSYAFIIDKRANKSQIKSAVEKFFNVTVESVNTLNTKGKSKMFRGRLPGVRASLKKAIIKLSKNDRIDTGIWS